MASRAKDAAGPRDTGPLTDAFHDVAAELGLELGVPEADAEPLPTTVTKPCAGSDADFFAFADFPGRSKEWIALNVVALVCVDGATDYACALPSGSGVKDGSMRVRCAGSASGAALVKVNFVSR